MITGKNIVIQGIAKEDYADIFTFLSTDSFHTFAKTTHLISEFEYEKWLENSLLSNDRKLFVISEMQGGKKLGVIGLKNFDYMNRHVELFMTAEVSGNFASDAAKTLSEYCFRHLNMHKVYLTIFETNKRAIKCYEKVGFIQEGVLKDHHFCNYTYENIVIMAKTNEKD